MWKFFKKEKIIKNNFNFNYFKNDYENMLKNRNIADKIILLSFYIKLLQKDLQASIINEYFCTKVETTEIRNLLNFIDYLKYETSDTKEIDLSNDCVITGFWNYDRIADNVLNIGKNDFSYKEDNHRAKYLTNLDITIVSNGYHSTTTGVVFGKGKIIANIIDMTKVFPLVDTDGEHWIDVATKKPYKEIYDKRFAMIYSLAKEKYLLENEYNKLLITINDNFIKLRNKYQQQNEKQAVHYLDLICKNTDFFKNMKFSFEEKGKNADIKCVQLLYELIPQIYNGFKCDITTKYNSEIDIFKREVCINYIEFV